MSISIIIPAYNGEKYLATTLESVRVQTVSDWELVVIDDGSTDGTLAVAQEYARRDGRIRAVAQENGGVVSARNRGVSEARADLVALLDQDDVWEPDALETLRGALELHPEAVAAHGVPREIDRQGCPIPAGGAELWGRRRKGISGARLVEWPDEQPTTFNVLAYWCCISTPGQALIRRAALEAIGPLDPACWPSDDWDMWLRLSRLGPLAFVPRVVIGWRQHEGNVSKRRGLMRQAELTLRRKLLAACADNPEQRHLARLGWRFGERMQLGLRLGWAGEHWAKREFLQAAKQLRHAAVCGARSLAI